ncbi:peritrophin-44-like [Teleopsis dalmanni]|uniref:peritrophin-44-like n=1 Tax=Teleopsis dalmanni TaxID=139649 RepID=UPI0018CE8646|nr:peritrophin-44-like [Teleopsis dalmanni]
MKLTLPVLTIVAVIFCVTFDGSNQAETFLGGNDICRLLADGAKLRKPGYCDTGIECQNGTSVDVITCSGTTPYYDRQTAACAKSTSDSYCSAPCKLTSSTYVVDPKNCQGWYQCSGTKVVKQGYCPDGMVLDQKNQQCDYADQVSCTAEYEFCDLIPSNTPFRDEDSCNEYFTCPTKGTETTSVTCDDGTYYVAELADCIPKAQVDCAQHPYPNQVCGNSKIALRNRFVSDGATCRGYFYCQDLGVGVPDENPIWGQCPENLFFEPNEEACMARTYIKCEEDRCDGRGNGLALSETYGCQYYLQCQNNYTLSEEYCGAKLYFNEDTQSCTSVNMKYPVCM